MPITGIKESKIEIKEKRSLYDALILSSSSNAKPKNKNVQQKIDKCANRLRQDFEKEYGSYQRKKQGSAPDPLQLFVNPPVNFCDEKGDHQQNNAISVIRQFIESEKRSLLILGDAGQGKTLLLKVLTFNLWERYKKTREAGFIGEIPIYIHLPKLRSLKELLPDFFSSYSIPMVNRLKSSQQPIILLLDGYDETHELGKHDNLFKMNDWQEWNVRIMTVSRREKFIQEEPYYFHFCPINKEGCYENKKFQEFNLVQFREEEIKQYIESYLQLANPKKDKAKILESNIEKVELQDDWEQAAAYLRYINKNTLPALFELARTPMVLSMIVTVLPHIIKNISKKIISFSKKKESEKKEEKQENKIEVLRLPLLNVAEPWQPEDKESQKKGKQHNRSLIIEKKSSLFLNAEIMMLTRAQIYDEFTEQWFKKQIPYLLDKVPSLRLDAKDKEKMDQQCIALMQCYTTNLAFRALRQGKFMVYFDAEATLKPELLRPLNAKQEEIHHQIIEKLEVQDLIKALESFRRVCLLKVSDKKFVFMHKTLIEYFTSQHIFNNSSAMVEFYALALQEDQYFFSLFKEEMNKFLAFNYQSLVGEPRVMHFLADRVKQDDAFRRLLWALVKQSQNNPRICIAAANAISVLNMAHENFSGEDFTGIQIPGANLSGALCDQTIFSNADLRGVSFSQAWLQGADFSGAIMADILFGEQAFLPRSCGLLCCVYSPNNQWVAIGSQKGSIHLYSSETGERITYLRNWSFRVTGLRWNPVYSLSFCYNSQLLAVGSGDGYIRLWDVENKKCLLEHQAHTGAVRSIAFLPHSIEFIVSGSDDRQLKRWHLNQAKLTLIKTSPVQSQTISALVCIENKDENLIAFASGAKVNLWNSESGKIELLLEHKHTVTGLVCSLRETTPMIAASSGSMIILYDVTRRNITQNLQGLPKNMTCLAYRPNEAEIISGSQDGRIWRWNLKTDEAEHIIGHHREPVNAIAYQPQAQCITSISDDGTIYQWKLAASFIKDISIKPFHEYTNNHVRAMAIRADGKEMVVRRCGNLDSVELLEMPNGRIKHIFKTHGYGRVFIFNNIDEDEFTSEGYVNDSLYLNFKKGWGYITVNSLALRRPKSLDNFERQSLKRVLEETKLDLLLLKKKPLEIVDAKLVAKIITACNVYECGFDISFLVYRPDNKEFAAGFSLSNDALNRMERNYRHYVNLTFEQTSVPNAVSLWNVESLKFTTALGLSASKITGIAYHPVRPEIAINVYTKMAENYHVKVWLLPVEEDLAAPKKREVGCFCEDLKSAPERIARRATSFTYRLPDGKQILINFVCQHPISKAVLTELILFDSVTFKFISIVNTIALGGYEKINFPTSMPLACRFDGLQIALGKGLVGQNFNMPAKIRLIDIQRKIVQFELSGYKGYITALAYRKNQYELASSGKGKKVRIWNSATGQCLQILEHPHEIIALTWSTQGDYLFVGIRSGGCYAWKVQNNSAQEEKTFKMSLQWSTERWPLMLAHTQIDKVKGLSHSNFTLFRQRKAMGTPAAKETPIPADPRLLIADHHHSDVKLFDIHKLTLYKTAHCEIKPQRSLASVKAKLQFSYEQWVVSVLRKPNSKTHPNHVFIVVEGIDAFGRGLLLRYDLYYKPNNPNVGRVFCNVKTDLLLEKYNAAFFAPDFFINEHKFSTFSVRVPRAKAISLHQAVLADIDKEIPFHPLGDRSILGNGGDNCFTWVRKKLLIMNDDDMNQRLQSKIWDKLVSHPKFYALKPVSDEARPVAGYCSPTP